MKKLISISLIVLLGLFQACKEEVMCTEEFRAVGISVIGDSLTNFYTVRNSNLDTIKFPNNIEYSSNHWYPVLDDNYQSKIANSQESFKFIGEINDTIVVNEVYVINADDCHINKVSGKSEVVL